MSFPRYRLLARIAATALLLSFASGRAFAAGPPPIDANVADKDIGVGYGNIIENTNAFDLVVNLAPPENKTIVSSEKHDDDGDIIWQGPTKTTISDPPKREKHTWTGAGVLSNLQHQVRFHGTFTNVVGGPGPGGGMLPEFDVGVVDLDIDVNCTAADTGAHSPPTGSPAEDKKEDEPLAGGMVEKGMIERLDPNNHALPGTITPVQLATLPYTILRLNCQPRWHQSDSHIGDVAFTGSALDSSCALYDIASGQKVSSLTVPTTGLQKDLAIVTNNSFTAITDITATYTWNSQKTKNQSGAEDIVRVMPLTVDLDIDGLDDTQEVDPGGLVARQYQTQPVPRKAIILNSNATLGHVTLAKSNSKVKVFDAASRGTEITFNGTDNKLAAATLPKTLYVQGIEGSGAMRDVTLTLTHSEWGGSDSVSFTVFYLQSLTPSTWDVLCKGQGKVLPVSADIAPTIPDFDPNLVDWECNAGTLPGGGTTAHGLNTTWAQDNTYLSASEDDVFVKAQCGSNGEWVTINTTIVELDTVTVRHKSYPSNTVTVNSGVAGDLYLRDAGNGVTIEMEMTTIPTVSQSQWDKVRWRISGSAATPSSGTFAGAPEATLTPSPNRTFTVEVGFDKNSNGVLDTDEVTRTVYVYLIAVVSMTVTDSGTPTNTVTNPPGTSLVVAEGPASGHAVINLGASWLPGAAGVGAHVLWTATGASPAPASGNFGAGVSSTIQLTGSDGDRTAIVSVGVDGNANGSLDPGEVSYSVTVLVARVVLTVEDAGGALGAVPLTECMEGRNVTFTATVTDGFPCGVANPMCFTFHYQRADGTPWTEDDWSTDRVEDNTPVADQVPDGDADHKFTTPIYVVAHNDGFAVASNTLNIDVYELWVKDFKDHATGRAWKVCVFRWIAYEAYASSDCESWSWDMPDGVPDAWNPVADGDFARAGHNMYIPNSDKARASNSWFGDTYGTVYVFCEDGDGNNHSFYSTSISPSKKAKVFFDPDTGVDGEPPSQQNPPAWFVFWKNGNVVDGMGDFGYLHTAGLYGQWTPSNRTLSLGPLACGTNSGPETLYDMNGNPFTMTGQGRHLYCVSQTMSHESYHKYCTDNFGGAPQTDSDGISDAEEVTPHQAYYPASNPNNSNTFGYSYVGTYQDQEVRARIKELHNTPTVDVSKDWSADSENAKWIDP